MCDEKTKISDHDLLNCDKIWGNGLDIGWIVKNSIGQAGGLWSSWKKDKFDYSSS